MESTLSDINLFQMHNAFILFIIGITASGKSRLAFDLAQKFNGVIINADSMQIYENYGIMTAKPSEEEMNQVPHRMYGNVSIDTDNYNVTNWYEQALSTINEVVGQGKLPIVGGGTCYYAKQLLFKSESDSMERAPMTLQEIEDKISELTLGASEKQKITDVHEYQKQKYWLNLDEEEKTGNDEEKLFDKDAQFKLLEIIDPKLSNFLLPINVRKVFAALKKFYNGKGQVKESDFRLSQKFKIRYPSLVIRLNADKEKIEQRVSKRIGKMLFELQKININTTNEGYSTGILEIGQVFDYFTNKIKEDPSKKLDFERGILQSIGYKEFYSLYQMLQDDHPEFITLIHSVKNEGDTAIQKITEFINEHEAVANKIEEGKQNLIMQTMRYTVYQNKYMRKKISKLIGNSHIYKEIVLNEAEDYHSLALQPSIEFLESIYNSIERTSSMEHLLQSANVHTPKNSVEEWTKNYGIFCSKTVNGEEAYQKHLKSKRHRHFYKEMTTIKSTDFVN